VSKKKKIKVCRASGLPVQFDNIDKFKAESLEAYNKIVKKLGVDESQLMDQATSERFSRLMRRIEASLAKRHGNMELWEPITSQKAMMAAVKQFGPIMIAQDGSTGNLAYVIFDIEV
jgi:hypothetical protein